MTHSRNSRTFVTIDPRDYVVIEQLAEQRRSTPAQVARELIGKAIDAGLAK